MKAGSASWPATCVAAVLWTSLLFAQQPAATDSGQAPPERTRVVEAAQEPEEAGEQVFTWADSLQVKRGVVFEEVEDREPEYAGTVFGRDVELLFCHTPSRELRTPRPFSTSGASGTRRWPLFPSRWAPPSDVALEQ